MLNLDFDDLDSFSLQNSAPTMVEVEIDPLPRKVTLPAHDLDDLYDLDSFSMDDEDEDCSGASQEFADKPEPIDPNKGSRYYALSDKTKLKIQSGEKDGVYRGRREYADKPPGLPGFEHNLPTLLEQKTLDLDATPPLKSRVDQDYWKNSKAIDKKNREQELLNMFDPDSFNFEDDDEDDDDAQFGRQHRFQGFPDRAR